MSFENPVHFLALPDCLIIEIFELWLVPLDILYIDIALKAVYSNLPVYKRFTDMLQYENFCINLLNFELHSIGSSGCGLMKWCGNRKIKLKHLQIPKKYNFSQDDYFFNGPGNASTLESIDFSKWRYSNHVKSILTIKNILRYSTALTCLSLSQCVHIDDECLHSMRRFFKNLNHLDLTCCSKITDESIRIITNNSIVLESLILSYCQLITDQSLQYIADKCPFIKKLDLSYLSVITDDGIIVLSVKLKELKELKLHECRQLQDIGIQSILKNCSELSSLDISYTNPSDDCFLSCLLLPYHLKELNLSNCYRITNLTINKLILECVELQSLAISSCEFITKLGYETLTLPMDTDIYVNTGIHVNTGIPLKSNIRTLKKLDLSSTIISDISIQLAIQYNPMIISLNLAGVSHVTDQTILIISHHLLLLESIIVSYCYNITNFSILEILINCKHLTALNVASCYLITDQVLDYIIINNHILALIKLNMTNCDITVSALERLVRLRNDIYLVYSEDMHLNI
eukprot:gene14729-19797_t